MIEHEPIDYSSVYFYSDSPPDPWNARLAYWLSERIGELIYWILVGLWRDIHYWFKYTVRRSK